MLVVGESTATTPPATAEQIRYVGKHDTSTFGEGIPDRVLITG
jgi:hypothetical protein